MKRETVTGVYVYNGETIEFNMYTSIRAKDKLRFINDVIDTIIVNNYYYSIIRDLVFDAMIISVFTDIVLPEDIYKIEEFLEETSIINIIKSNIDYGIIMELNKAIDDNIAYRTGIHKNPVADSLSLLLNTIEQKVFEIDNKSMVEMVQVIGGVFGELTADKMLEAYVNSDVFKQKGEQITSNREEHNARIDAIVEEAEKTTSKKKKAASKK